MVSQLFRQKSYEGMKTALADICKEVESLNSIEVDVSCSFWGVIGNFWQVSLQHYRMHCYL